ncbi:MAG: nucleotide exchange factor GrpE [Acidobacteriota bacterium]|nr:MAG: nucleotide exchange factor GrpE [Acidobacteriota bacterium]
MNPNDQIPMPEEALDEMETDNGASVDDFLKQLAERERDLHITSDLSIEIEDSEFDPRNISEEAIEPVIERASDPMSLPVSDEQPAAAAAANQPGLKTQVFELQQELSKLKNRVEELKAERNDIQEKSDRRLKDFESYKYRMDRERRGSFIDQISNLATQMLPVLDNLDRAIDSATSDGAAKSEDFQRFYDGIVLVNQQVREVFAEMGVEPISAVGKDFDPNLHEAVAMDESPDMPPNTVVDEMLRGYRIGNRVIRHSMVKVTPAAAYRRDDIPAEIPAAIEETPQPAVVDVDIDAAFEDAPEKENSPQISE